MSLVMALSLGLLAFALLLVLPALALQWALRFWFPPAEQVAVGDAWLVRFEQAELGSSPMQS